MSPCPCVSWCLRALACRTVGPLLQYDLNFEMTVLGSWGIGERRAGLQGGAHVIVDNEFARALVITDSDVAPLVILYACASELIRTRS